LPGRRLSDDEIGIRQPRRPVWVIRVGVRQHTNARHSVGLLRTDRERPRCRCSTEKANELTSPHIRTQGQRDSAQLMSQMVIRVEGGRGRAAMHFRCSPKS
jgi:hypothetical protein